MLRWGEQKAGMHTEEHVQEKSFTKHLMSITSILRQLPTLHECFQLWKLMTDSHLKHIHIRLFRFKVSPKARELPLAGIALPSSARELGFLRVTFNYLGIGIEDGHSWMNSPGTHLWGDNSEVHSTWFIA